MTWRRVGSVFTAALAFLLLRQLWRYGDVAWAAIHFPFGLDYGEGIVWQQAALMFTPAAYGDITTFPMVVFHYTPLFHLASRFVAAVSDADLLSAGRVVSIMSTLGCCAAIAALVDSVREPGDKWTSRATAGGAGALAMLCVKQVVAWGPLMRVDMLAHLFSLTGLWFGIRAFRDHRLIYAASLCFLCAVYTKQNSIAAPIALFSAALLLQPRLAARGLACCVAGGVAAMAILVGATDGRILRHVFLYNVNRADFSQLKVALWIGAQDLGLVAASVIGAAALAAPLWTRFRSEPRRIAFEAIRRSQRDSAAMVLVLYASVTTVMLLGIAKVGASFNYTIEWLLSLCILSGASVSLLVRDLAHGNSVHADKSSVYPRVLFGPLLLASQAIAFVPFDTAALSQPRFLGELRALTGRIAAASKPVVSDDMVLVLRAGKLVEIEPAIAAELGSVGIWDEGPYVERILRGDFSMFITEEERGKPLFDTRYNPAVADAMAKAYPVIEHIAGYTLHLPRRSPRLP
ncbi:MAG: hypothetical protein H7099_12415 [Gemmatimonadaceae bacterium]|nr:hypothetical protein [Gemmatimonadaceae bacterium]